MEKIELLIHVHDMSNIFEARVKDVVSRNL